MRAMQQLRLVKTETPSLDGYSKADDPVQRVFGEYLDWFGKSPARCKLGPQRRAAIAGALQLYPEDMLQQALVGASADEWLAQQSGLGVEWILANEARIERFADVGLRIQARAGREAAQPVVQVADAAPTPEQQAQAAAARERMRAMARRLSGRSEVADE